MSPAPRPSSPLKQAENDALTLRDQALRAYGALGSRAEKESRELTVVEQREQRRLLGEIGDLSVRVKQFGGMVADSRARASIRREPSVYDRHGEHSWFSDLARMKLGLADPRVTERLQRHAKEMEHVDLRALQDTARETRQRGIPTEKRVNPNRVDGQGGFLSPPKWLVEDFATFPRAERVLSTLIGPLPLPARPGFSTINLPRVTTGNVAAPANDLAAGPSADMTDAQVSTPLVPIAGLADVALQLLEQSPAGAAHLDQVIFRELTSAYDAQVEAQLFNGTGGTTQLLGILSAVPAANQVTYTAASPTGLGMYPFLAQTGGAVANARKRPPTAFLARWGRWAWLASQVDDQHRPYVLPSSEPAELDEQSTQAMTDLFGVPLYVTEAIPTNLGAGLNQDAVIACRPQGMRLWESDAQMDVMTEPLSGALGVRIRFRAYVGAMVARYPSGLASLTGTGLVVQTNL